MTIPDWARQIKSHPQGLAAIGLLAVVLLLILSRPAMALIEVGVGNNPVADNNWPAGSVAMANLKSRAGWWEGPPFGGGQHCFLYRGDAAAFQQAADAFAAVKAPALQLFVHDGGPAESSFLKDAKDAKDPKGDTHYDWSFTVWNPQSWNHLYNSPGSRFSAEDPNGGLHQAVDPPRLDVYVGGGRGIDFSKVKVPANVAVTDERADAAGYPGGSALVGDVYDMTTSKPVAGARIAVARQKAENEWDQAASTAADADGHFELKGVPKGSFGVLASADGYAPRLLGYAEFRGNTLKRFTARLAPAAGLSGTAVDTDDKPVAGATIRADAVTSVDGRGYVLPQRRQVVTDAQGRFQLTGLPHGHAQLFAYAEHYLGLDVLKVYSVPEAGLKVRLTATGAIRGRVLDKAGHPAPGANVSIQPPGDVRDHLGKWGASGNVAPDGSFHFENVPPGEYVIFAMETNPGHAASATDPSAKRIIVKPGETAEVEVTGQ